MFALVLSGGGPRTLLTLGREHNGENEFLVRDLGSLGAPGVSYIMQRECGSKHCIYILNSGCQRRWTAVQFPLETKAQTQMHPCFFLLFFSLFCMFLCDQ